MTKYVRTDTPPDDFRPSLEALKARRREPNKVAQVPAQAVAAWLEAKEKVRAAEDAEEAARALLLVHLGEAEAGASEAGLVTFMEQKSRRLDAARLREELPEVAAKYETTSTCRVLRHKAPKAGKER